MKTVVPQYKIPSRKTFNNLLDCKYRGVAVLFRSKIQNAGNYSLIIDVWTECLQTKSFVGIRVRFGANTEIHTATLGVYELDDRQTAGYISEKLLAAYIE